MRIRSACCTVPQRVVKEISETLSLPSRCRRYCQIALPVCGGDTAVKGNQSSL